MKLYANVDKDVANLYLSSKVLLLVAPDHFLLHIKNLKIASTLGNYKKKACRSFIPTFAIR